MQVVKKRRKKRSVFIPFFLTFSIVLLVGSVFLLVVHQLQQRTKKNTNFPEEAKTQTQTTEANLGLVEKIQIGELETSQGTEEALAIEPGRYDELLADEDFMKKEKIVSKEAKSEDEVTLAFAGDILFDPRYAVMSTLKQRGGDITDSFSKELLDIMQDTDIFMLNNEFTYTNRGTPVEGKQYTFRADPERAKWLELLGVDAVSLANNHAYDYGEVSLLDTMEALDQASIPYAGAGKNIEEAAKPISFICNDIKISVIAATQIERLDRPDTVGAGENTPGVFRCFNPDKLYEVIKKTKETSDFVVVYIHWGTEGTTELDWLQTTQVEEMAGAGADLIVGNHTHCLQEIGYVKGVPVVYSLGNFLFNSKKQNTCILKAVVTRDGLSGLYFLPAVQENCMTRLATGDEWNQNIQEMQNLSKSALIGQDGLITPK